MFLMLAVIVVFMVLPQRKKAREQKTFLEEMKKGDEVVTNSGMLGRIDKIEGAIITLNVGNKTYVQFTKNAISKELSHAVHPKEAVE